MGPIAPCNQGIDAAALARDVVIELRVHDRVAAFERAPGVVEFAEIFEFFVLREFERGMVFAAARYAAQLRADVVEVIAFRSLFGKASERD